MSLRADFADAFSRSAFQAIDGESYIVGKWGRTSQLDDGTYDVWFIGPNLSPLSARKLASIRRNVAQQGGFRELTGEGYTQGRGRAFVLAMAPICGIKKKRKVAPGFRGGLGIKKPGAAATATGFEGISKGQYQYGAETS